MEDRRIADILRRLGTSASQPAWEEFLQDTSPVIFQVVGLFEREPDARADCFLFVCEQLSRNGFRRLRSFRPEGRASFLTWLRVVVRNLCLDWHRKEFGRYRVFQSVSRLAPLDRLVFSTVFERGLREDEALATLQAERSDLTPAQFGESLNRVRQALTPRQRWLLAARRPVVESLSGESNEERPAPGLVISDPKPSPESVLIAGEHLKALEQAFVQLSGPERLILRLRFEQGLKLREVADLLGLKDIAAADRRIREILDKLREMLPAEFQPDEKK